MAGKVAEIDSVMTYYMQKIVRKENPIKTERAGSKKIAAINNAK